MAIRNFSFTLISANNLPDIRNFGSMKLYAKVSLRDIAGTEYQTSIDELNGTNPKWNTLFKYRVMQSALQESPGVILDVKLYCQRTFGDKYVGQVNIHLNKLFEGSLSNPANMTVKVDNSQNTEGTIEFSYNFGDLETVGIDDKKDGRQSFLGAIAEHTVTALAEEVTTVVLGMLGA